MQDVRIGDLVVEISIGPSIALSTSYVAKITDCVGTLESVTLEKVDFNDPDFVWDEETEGRPHPTERVYYLRTCDNRSFRWVNATIIRCPLSDNYMRYDAPLRPFI